MSYWQQRGGSGVGGPSVPVDDHLPPWVQGDATDPRGQLYRMTKFDQGLTAAAGMPLVFKNPGYVFGQVLAAGIADGSITSAKILDGTITNADINAAAAIAYSKLNLANSIVSSDIVDGTIVNADINAAAAIAWTKMAAFPGARVKGSTQVIATNTSTTVSWSSQTITNTTYFTFNGTTTLTCQLAGVYLITFGCAFPPAAVPTGERIANMQVNAVVIAGSAFAANPQASVSSECAGATQLRLAVNDTLTLGVRHQQGANLTWVNNDITFMAAQFMGA